MKILLTGAAGLIGGAVLRAAADRNDLEFVAVDDFSSGDWRNLKSLKGHFAVSKAEEFRRGGLTIDRVVHLAADTNTRADSRMHFGSSLAAARNMLSIARQDGVPFLLASSAAVYGAMRPDQIRTVNPLNGYGLAKLLAERECMEYHQSAAFRFFNVYGGIEAGKEPRCCLEGWEGNSSSMVYQIYKQAKAGTVRLFKHGEQRRDFIDCDSVAGLVLKWIDNPRSGVFDVGTGRTVSFVELVGLVSEASGFKRPTIEFIDNNRPEEYQSYTCADEGPAQDTFGWRPRDPVGGIVDAVQFWRGNGL